MKPGGILVSTLQMPPEEHLKAHRVRGPTFHVKGKAAQLRQIGELLEAGQVQIVVTQTFPLSNASQAQIRSKAADSGTDLTS